MKATITSKGQITIPLAIRERLGLTAGQTLDFDTSVPYLKATRVIDRKKMRSTLGCLKDQLRKSSDELLAETRGAVDLPSKQVKKKRK